MNHGDKQNILIYELHLSTRRITLDVLWQHSSTINKEGEGWPYIKFTASNGIHVISNTQVMLAEDIVFLKGSNSEKEPRSGAVEFESDEKRNAAYIEFVKAIDEWAEHNNGYAKLFNRTTQPPNTRRHQP